MAVTEYRNTETLGKNIYSKELGVLDDDLKEVIFANDWQMIGSSELVQVQIARNLKDLNSNLRLVLQELQAQR